MRPAPCPRQGQTLSRSVTQALAAASPPRRQQNPHHHPGSPHQAQSPGLRITLSGADGRSHPADTGTGAGTGTGTGTDTGTGNAHSFAALLRPPGEGLDHDHGLGLGTGLGPAAAAAGPGAVAGGRTRLSRRRLWDGLQRVLRLFMTPLQVRTYLGPDLDPI